MDSLVPHPGAAHTRPAEYVRLGRGSVRTAGPRNLSACLRLHPSRGPVWRAWGTGPLYRVRTAPRAGSFRRPGRRLADSGPVHACGLPLCDGTYAPGVTRGGRAGVLEMT